MSSPIIMSSQLQQTNWSENEPLVDIPVSDINDASITLEETPSIIKTSDDKIETKEVKSVRKPIAPKKGNKAKDPRIHLEYMPRPKDGSVLSLLDSYRKVCFYCHGVDKTTIKSRIGEVAKAICKGGDIYVRAYNNLQKVAVRVDNKTLVEDDLEHLRFYSDFLGNFLTEKLGDSSSDSKKVISGNKPNKPSFKKKYLGKKPQKEKSTPSDSKLTTLPPKE